MGSKKISELTTGSLNPPLTAVTPIVYSGETFQQELSTLRETLVDSGSHIFSGDQTFNGDITVNGYVQQHLISSENIDLPLLIISGSEINGTAYNKVNLSFQDYSNSSFLYDKSISIEYFDSDQYNFGSEFRINGRSGNISVYASGSGHIGRMCVRDMGDGSTFANLYADVIEIGTYNESTNKGVKIGHIDVPYVQISGVDVQVTGSVSISGSLMINGEDISTEGIGKVKAKFTGNRRIEEITGYVQVDFTQAVYSTGVESIVYQDNNGNFDFSIIDTPELLTLYENRETFTRVEFSFDNQNTWREVVLSGGAIGIWRQIYFPIDDPDNYVTVTSGQTLFYRVVTGASPVRWFNAGGTNFRGAVIDFHAYSRDAGTIIGTIHIADDDGDDLITHTETKSGGSDLQYVDMWYRNPSGNEREIWFRRLDDSSDTLKIQWIAKMFYGDEYWD